MARLGNPSNPSTQYGPADLDALVALGREKIQHYAAAVKLANGRKSEFSLATLRRAWALAPAVDKSEGSARAQAAVDEAKATTCDLNELERRLGGEGRNGNFDCV